jgi:hypothetical protein
MTRDRERHARIGWIAAIFGIAAVLASTDAVPAQPTFKLERVGQGALLLVVDAPSACIGLETGFRHDADAIRILSVDRGPDFPEAEGELFLDLAPVDGCPTDPSVDAGFTIGAYFSRDRGLAIPAGRRAVLAIRFEAAPGAPPDACSLIKFAGCLGPPYGAVLIELIGLDGNPITASGVQGSSCGPVKPVFIRGDVNADGAIDLSDPSSLFGFLFRGDPGEIGCQAAADADDDGAVTIADALFLLRYQFAGGREPSTPFPRCGTDPADPAEGPECTGHTFCREELDLDP